MSPKWNTTTNPRVTTVEIPASRLTAGNSVSATGAAQALIAAQTTSGSSTSRRSGFARDQTFSVIPCISHGASKGSRATVATIANGTRAAVKSMSARALLASRDTMGATGARLKMSSPTACGSASGRTFVSSKAKAGPTTQPHRRVSRTSLTLRSDFSVSRRFSSRPRDAMFVTV
jgi:hypothetical protein